MTMRLPRPRHGDPVETTRELRALAAAVLHDDVHTLARTTSYLRRSYRVVFVGYVAMLVFGARGGRRRVRARADRNHDGAGGRGDRRSRA